MRFHVVTVLPRMFDSFLGVGLIGKAIERGLIAVDLVSPRDFATDRHRTVDDAPYGGGSGMVMMAEPVLRAVEEAERRSLAASGLRPLRVVLSAQGRRFDQAFAGWLRESGALTLVCGRYEGIDERAVARADLELSVGDYVLMGGEVAAMAVIETVARLVPGVLGNPGSILEESYAAGLLEGPQYTRPLELRGEAVPDVLLSGNHAAIARWRRRESLRRTFERRPDLLATARLDDEDRAFLRELERQGRASSCGEQLKNDGPAGGGAGG